MAKLLDSTALSSLLSQLKAKLSAIFCTKEEAQATSPIVITIDDSVTYNQLSDKVVAPCGHPKYTTAQLREKLEACSYRIILKKGEEVYIPDYVTINSRSACGRFFINGERRMLEYNFLTTSLGICSHTTSL